MNGADGPLSGVLVLDLSRVLAGPFCTMLLGDMGARVIKVEHPDGDVTRGWGPPFEKTSGLSAYYLAVNRNKESIVLDLSTAAGADSVRMLARRADVLVENFLPGGLEKLRLPLELLRAANPGLVTASITGFGRTGDDATLPGFDLLAQAGAGLMAITGAHGGPAKVGVAVSDLFAGLYALAGILARLRERERTGRGGHVEVDLFTSTLASLINVAQAALVTGEEAKRWGNAHPQITPYRPFTASDGDFILAVGTDRQFALLANLVGRPEWGEDPAYRTNAARVANREALERALQELFRTRRREEWIALCRGAGIPSGPVRAPLEALTSETARSLGAVASVDGVEFVASPIRLPEGTALRFPPKLDEHGDALRREFGLPFRGPQGRGISDLE